MLDLITLAAAKAYTDKKAQGGGGASSWNDLEDKPFGEVVGVSDTLTWDGVTNENTVGIPEAGVYLHPVSECVPSMEQFIGATMVVDANGQDKAVEVTSNMVSAMGDSLYSVASDTGLFVTTADNLEFNGLIFPKKGIYFQLLDLSDGVFYIKSLTIPNYEFTGSTVIKTIDPKYLPDFTLTAPNGTKYRLAVADDGTLSAVPVD